LFVASESLVESLMNQRKLHMTQYLLSVHYADGPPPPPEVLGEVMKNVRALREEMQAAGAWVYAGGLRPAHSARVVRAEGAKVRIMDGPFAEAKEYLGGFTIVAVEREEDALKWAGKFSAATGLPVEVRAFQPEEPTSR
jgi:hypothetical protein